jgi:hypothetical protein
MQKLQMKQQQGEEISLDNFITPDMIKLLRKDKLRSYRIEVETDSTVFEDAQLEKQSRTELLTAMSQFVAEWFPIIQAQPMLLPLAFEMLEFGVRGYKIGRSLEDVLEQAKTQLTNIAKEAAKQPPKPDPKVQAQELKNQQEAIKQQGQQQIQQQKSALAIEEMKMGMEKMQMEMQAHREKLGADLEAQRAEIGLLQHKLGLETAASMQKHNMEMQHAEHQHGLSMEQASQTHQLGMQMTKEKAKAPRAQ